MFHLFLVSPEILYGIWCMVICYDFRSVILQGLNKRVWFAKLALLFILQGHSSEEVVLQSICGACPSLAAGIVQLYASTIQILHYPPISGNKLTTPTSSRPWSPGTGGIQNRDKYALTRQKPKLYLS